MGFIVEFETASFSLRLRCQAWLRPVSCPKRRGFIVHLVDAGLAGLQLEKLESASCALCGWQAERIKNPGHAHSKALETREFKI